MNMLIFELKTEMKSFIIWTIVLMLILFIFMSGIYPFFLDSVDSLEELLSSYPPAFIEAFGFDFNTIFSFEGFYTFTYMYVILVGTIMAAAMSVGTFSREKRSKCSDFIFTKPVSRKQIFINKLLSNIILIIITNIIFSIVGMVLYIGSNETMLDMENFVLCLISLFFTQLVFMGFGIFIATFSKKVRSVSGVAVTVGFGTFLIAAIANIIDEDLIRFFSPQRYFDPYYLLTNNFYELKYAAMAIVVFIVCIFLAYSKFCKSDISTI